MEGEVSSAEDEPVFIQMPANATPAEKLAFGKCDIVSRKGASSWKVKCTFCGRAVTLQYVLTTVCCCRIDHSHHQSIQSMRLLSTCARADLLSTCVTCFRLALTCVCAFSALSIRKLLADCSSASADPLPLDLFLDPLVASLFLVMPN